MDLLEPSFAKLRRTAGESAGALQVLETRLTASLEDTPVTTQDQWNLLLSRAALEATALLAEVERRHDALNLEILPRTGRADHARFRDVVPTGDLEHVSVLAALAETRGLEILFVTLDSALHGCRDGISNAARRITVTTPAYLGRQIVRLRAKEGRRD